MNEEIKTEDIIKSLRVCCAGTDCVDCVECMFNTNSNCADQLMRLAADRLELLSNQHIIKGIDEIKAIVRLMDAMKTVSIAEYKGRKLYVGVWHHFKGKDYLVYGTAVHTETKETLVLYKDFILSKVQYARPIAMFMSEVDREKYPDSSQTYIFEKASERKD